MSLLHSKQLKIEIERIPLDVQTFRIWLDRKITSNQFSGEDYLLLHELTEKNCFDKKKNITRTKRKYIMCINKQHPVGQVIVY